MRKFTVLLVLIAALSILAAPTFAQSDSIVDVAVASDDFNTLVAAVQAAGLVDTLATGGPFTVFAPTDGAFNTLLSELDTSAEALLGDTELLTSVLTYHVVPGRVTAADILAADSLPFNAPTVNGASINVNFDGNRVILDGGRASVVQPDLFASNGVIHVIDNVLLPSAATAAPAAEAAAPAEAGAPNIAEAAIAGEFTTLVAAAQAAGLVDTLANGGPFTVFAPTDGAFATLLGELGVSAEELLGNTELLTAVLTYHVVPGRITSDQILNADLPLEVETVNGDTVIVGFDGNRVTLDGGRASVVQPDQFASNGVIHVIDNVILPD